MIALVIKLDRGAVGPHGTLIDPGADQADLFGRQPLAFLRHHFACDRPGDELHEHTLGAFAGNNRRTEIAADEGNILRVETEPRFLPQRSVASITAIGKDGLDILREIHRARGGRRQLGQVNIGGGGAEKSDGKPPHKARSRIGNHS